MSTTKQYRNVFTILEKVKKGEIVQEERRRLFTPPSFYKKPELVKPYLHDMDARSLGNSVERFIGQSNNHNGLIVHAISTTAKRDLKLNNNVSLAKEMHEIYQRFPKSVLNDLFNLYHKDIEKLKFEERTASNKFRYNLLERANDPTLKVMTKDSNVKSMIFTRAMVQYYLMMMVALKQRDEQAFEEMMRQLTGNEDPSQQGAGNDASGPSQSAGNPSQPGASPTAGQGQQPSGQAPKTPSGAPSQPTPQQSTPPNAQSSGQSGNGSTQAGSAADQLQKMMDSMMDSQTGKQMLQQVMDQAKKASEAVESIMNADKQEEIWEQGSYDKRAADNLDINHLNKIAEQFRTIRLNMSGIKEKIKRLLDKSVSYFSGRDETIHENIFDANSLAGLDDYVLLHPCLRKAFMEDIMITDKRKIGKIDIYVDVSGSMDSSSGIKNDDGLEMTKLVFAKALAMKMKEMDMLNEVYTFESQVKHLGNTMYDVLLMDGNGGTCINSVVRSIEENQRNALVITDAEDRCGIYSEYAFFIGVAGANFRYFDEEVIEQYAQKDQVVVFDGKKILRIDSQGGTITK